MALVKVISCEARGRAVSQPDSFPSGPGLSPTEVSARDRPQDLVRAKQVISLQ